MEMDVESSTNSSSQMVIMDMVFYISTSTPLYSTAWSPTSKGSYAGTCIFVILLAALFRGLSAAKQVLEKRWADEARNRRYVVVKGAPSVAETVVKSPDGKNGTLITERGSEESVRIVKQAVRGAAPWRLSVDLPRALVTAFTATVGYLLMLAVMTMNVGYFLSVLAGTFLGELVVGRYAGIDEH